MERPILYWISGSPPAWRVMLALVIKGIAFESRQLDHGAGENRAPEYLALNPKGQVPTLVWGDVVIRESMAILGWLDWAVPSRSIWGNDTAHAAQTWQQTVLFETDLRPSVTEIATGLLRGREISAGAIATLTAEADRLENQLSSTGFLGGEAPMANDIWLYPTLHWVARGVALNAAPPPPIARLTASRPSLAAWMDLMAALPGVAGTYPPHWRR